MNEFPSWQPISKAPKDGTLIMAYEPGCGMSLVKWMKTADGWTDYAGAFIHPTHWMHTPDIPKEFEDVPKIIETTPGDK